MSTQSTNPPVIFRCGHFDTHYDPCLHPEIGYTCLLDFHKVGNSPSDNKVVDMINAYVDNYPNNNGKQIIVTKTHEEIASYSVHSCEKELLEFTLDAETLEIKVIPKPEEKTVSIYNISLIKGLIKMLTDLQIDHMEFEFTGGLAEYRIGSDTPMIKDAVLIMPLTKNALGIKKYHGVYDMSIPPEFKKK